MDTVADRNNNPGNLKDPSTGQFRQFKSPQEGYAALLNDLETKKSGKSSTGLAPTSTLADFAKVYAPAKDQNNPAQYTANIANHMGVRPDAQLKDLDTGKWADAIAHSEGYSAAPKSSQMASAASGFVSPPQFNPSGIDTAEASTGTTTPPKSFGQKALDAAGTVGNFLFPIAGDIGGLIHGDNKKTGLQLAGDAALSALPLIPGLGEAGEGARGAGLLGKIAASPVARGAATGYGVGVAQNLSQGKGVGESIAPNINTIGGGLLGGAAPLATKAIGGILEKSAGIPGNVKPILSTLSDPSLYDKYINAAKARATDVRNPSPLEVAADYTEKAVQSMQKKMKQLGEEVGAAKKNEGNSPLKDVTPVLQSFAKNLEDKFGLKVFVSPTAQKVTLEKAEGRMKNVLTPKDEARVKNALSDLIKLRKTGNIRKASDVIDNLDSLVDYSRKDLLGNSNDPLEGFLKTTRHDLNEVVRSSSPALAEAKSRFSDLNTALESIKGAGGANLQRAELLLKRVFSGDQSQTSRDVFNTIKKETGIDLNEHAVLAKHAIDAVGDPSQTSLLSQIMQNAAKEGAPTIPSLILSGGKAALQRTIANPERIGRNIVQGKKGLIPSAISKGRPTKATLEAARAVSGLLGQ